MRAGEVMTRDVVTVGPDTSLGRVAQLLLDNCISAVPVVDQRGLPLGMVSEGDLVGRTDGEREARHDWWLSLVAGRRPPDFLSDRHLADRPAREVMSAPVVTVNEDTPLEEVARLLATYRIKRVPVLHDGKVAGVVSRADLLKALAAAQPKPDAAAKPHGGLFDWIDKQPLFGAHKPEPAVLQPAGQPEAPRVTAADFRHLIADHESEETARRIEARRAAADARRAQVKEIIDTHVSDTAWQELLHRAREAAEAGEKSVLLLRFPSQLTSDSGRAINISEPGWPATLRGEPAEIYLRWERELRPNGFHLSARILDFPGGVPGDIGLFLAWDD